MADLSRKEVFLICELKSIVPPAGEERYFKHDNSPMSRNKRRLRATAAGIRGLAPNVNVCGLTGTHALSSSQFHLSFFFSFFNFLFSLIVSLAFFLSSLLDLSFFPFSPITTPSVLEMEKSALRFMSVVHHTEYVLMSIGSTVVGLHPHLCREPVALLAVVKSWIAEVRGGAWERGSRCAGVHGCCES